MLDGKKAYALSKKYTDDSLAGAGAVAGVPCQIQSITPITGGNRVTFLWVDNNGDSHTSTMDVKDGAKGETGETGATGKGIKSMTINSSNHLIVTYDDDTTSDAGEVPNVQSDWNEDDSTADSFIKNKPTLGTASAKNYTDTVRPNSHDLVESNAVANAINQALTSVYTPRGDLSCAELTSALLIAENVGNVYEMSDTGETSALFIQGAGIPIAKGNNVGIIKANADTYMFNYMGNSFDLHDYQKKDLASPIESASTVEGALGALSTNKLPVGSITNPNLLDNPWFTVNQRGESSYTTSGYSVDRWILGEGSLTSRTVSTPYILLTTLVANTNAWVRQKTEFDFDTTKHVTYSAIIESSVTSDYGFSLKMSNMDDLSQSKTEWFATTSGEQVLVSMTELPYKNTAFEIVANAQANASVKIYALKVELGSVSTLAMDTVPNYATELLKCQRYFVRYAGAGYPEICHAIESSGVTAWGLCFLPVPMRTKPSVAFANVNAYRLSDDSATAITTMEIHALANNACKIMFTLASNGVNGAVVEIQPNSALNGYVDFSADL